MRRIANIPEPDEDIAKNFVPKKVSYKPSRLRNVLSNLLILFGLLFPLGLIFWAFQETDHFLAGIYGVIGIANLIQWHQAYIVEGKLR